VRKNRANDWLPPADWTEREALREKGQFWTPPWVAEAMVAYVSAEAEAIFDRPSARVRSFGPPSHWRHAVRPKN